MVFWRCYYLKCVYLLHVYNAADSNVANTLTTNRGYLKIAPIYYIQYITSSLRVCYSSRRSCAKRESSTLCQSVGGLYSCDG